MKANTKEKNDKYVTLSFINYSIPRPKRTTRLHQRLTPNTNNYDNNLDASSNPEKQSDIPPPLPAHTNHHTQVAMTRTYLAVLSSKSPHAKEYSFLNKSNQKITHNHLRLTFTTSIHKQTIAHFSLYRSCSRK